MPTCARKPQSTRTRRHRDELTRHVLVAPKTISLNPRTSSTKSASSHTLHNTQHPDWARGHNGHGTIVTRKRKVRGKQHCTPAGPTHTACVLTQKVMISWTSTTSLYIPSAGSGGLAAGSSTRGTELSRPDD
eukprot:scaffold58583_cov79-Phaeocystis_antarctica.AAC.1